MQKGNEKPMLGIVIGDQPSHIVNLVNIKNVLEDSKTGAVSKGLVSQEEVDQALQWVDDIIETYNTFDIVYNTEQVLDS